MPIGDAALIPGFFIVGAPKCGTTAICDFLNQHPSLYIPEIKEPNFFGADLTGIKSAKNVTEYLEFFTHGQGRLCGEGSTGYLFSECAAKDYHEFNPSAKIIIMLRNPVDLMYSLHSQLLYNGYEEILDFGEALSMEQYRRKKLNIPAECRRPEALLYTEVVKFHDQVVKNEVRIPGELLGKDLSH
jgi:hypothetical protein